MDIEDTLNENNLKKYYDFTKSFHNIYLNNPDMSFNRLISLSRSQNKSFKLNVNKMILRNTFLQMVKENLVEKDKNFLKIFVKKLKEVNLAFNQLVFLHHLTLPGLMKMVKKEAKI